MPLAFADLDGWPALGTFDILDLRLNGYDFHMGLMAGTERWTDARTKAVFEKWRELLPYTNEDALALSSPEGTALLVNKQAGMFYAGTSALSWTPSEEAADFDFFAFPTLGTEFDAEAGIDAPMDGFVLSKAPRNPDAARKLMKCLGTGAAKDVYLAISLNTAESYTHQQKSAEIIGSSRKIAQFFDRDTIGDFGGASGMQAQLRDFLNAPDQDLDAYLSGIQAIWDAIAAEQ